MNKAGFFRDRFVSMADAKNKVLIQIKISLNRFGQHRMIGAGSACAKNLICLGVGLITVGIFMGAALASSASDLFGKGMDFERQGEEMKYGTVEQKAKMDEAINYCTQALKLDHDLYQAYFVRGRAYYIMNLYDDAISDITRGLGLHQMPEGYMMRSYAFEGENNLSAAIDDCSSAIGMAPSDALLYSRRGLLYDEVKGYKEAIIDQRKAIELAPAYPFGYSRLGLVFSHMGRYEDSIEQYSKAIALDPKEDSFYFNRAIAFDLLGKRDQAIEDLRKWLSIAPVDHVFYRSIKDKVQEWDDNHREKTPL